MSDDLVQRLRTASDDAVEHGDRVDTDILDEAADRIEALEAELASIGDPSRTSHFEYRDSQVRTVTYTSWRPLPPT